MPALVERLYACSIVFAYAFFKSVRAYRFPEEPKLGGRYIGHVGPIAVNEDAVIGDNYNLSFGVVIGADNRGKRKGAPRIGNCV